MVHQQSTAIIRLTGKTEPRVESIYPRTSDAQLLMTTRNLLVYFVDPSPVDALRKGWENLPTLRMPREFLAPVLETRAGGRLTHALTLDEGARIDVTPMSLGVDRDLVRLQLGALSIDVLDQAAFRGVGEAIETLGRESDRSFLPTVDLTALRPGFATVGTRDGGVGRQLRME